MSIEQEIYNLGVKEKELILNADMKEYTSLKIGGKAKYLIKIKDVSMLKKVLAYAKERNKRIIIIGNGTNILVKDTGITAAIILKIEIEGIEYISNQENANMKIIVGGGVKLGFLAQKILQEGLTGFEELAGIPGTIGGAIRMNAGAYGVEIKDIVTLIYVLDYQGNEYVLKNSQMEFGYRTSILKQQQYIVYKVEMELQKGKIAEIKEKMEKYVESRIKTQPVGIPSAGSTFKRGKDFITAKLIDEAGLKGKRIGDISVSDKHAGFVVNNEKGTAHDMLELIELVKSEVLKKFDKNIELEIEIIGD